MVMHRSLDELLDEAWKVPGRARNAMRFFGGEIEAETAPTPYEVVACWGRVRLLYYPPQGEVRPCPLLMVPSIINRYYVLDLRPGASMVEYLTSQGTPVYMIDWGTPGPQDRYADMEQHILGWMHAAVRRACRHAGVPRVHMLGYCIGGTMATIYAALRPARVAGLIALTAPVDFHDQGILSVWARSPDFPVRRLVDFMGLMDSDFLQSSFALLKPVSHPQKWRGLLHNLWDDRFLDSFLPMETWVNDNVDVPGAAYLQLIEDLYKANGLIEGSFELAGEPVRLEEIDCPVLVAVSERDHIVPDPSARTLADHVTSEDRTVMAFPGGHIGVVVGRAARTQLWPGVESWLEERPVVPSRERN